MSHKFHISTFSSLKVRNYRLFFFGGMVSNIGAWMGRTALAWLVLTVLTDHSASALGWAISLQFGPMLFLAPYGGVIADRFPKRTILMVTQVALALNQLVTWALILTGSIQLWHVYVLSTLMALTAAFDNPARQAFASEMVGPDLLSNAVGLNATSFNFARLVGPGIAGLLIAAVGVAPAFLINGLSYAAVIYSLLAMRGHELQPVKLRKGSGAFREGVRYAMHRPDIIMIIILVFIFGALGMNFQITNLLMATAVYGKGAAEFGILGTIMAIGSLTGALLAASRKRPRLGYLLASLFAFAIFAALLGSAPSYFWYCVWLVPVGLVAITAMNNANARIQLTVDPEVRGRVLSLYMAIFMGSTFVGAPIIGWIGDVLGARWTILVGSVGTGIAFVGACVYLLLSHTFSPAQFRAALSIRRVFTNVRPVEATSSQH